MNSLALFVFCLLLCSRANGWWLFSSSEPTEEPEQTQEVAERRPVKFEISSVEQKFLAEAQQFLDLPQLDKCQHLVISQLRTSCGNMHEEELGKLAVELLNCQSKTEGRQVFTCTDSMSLADCTGPMDASTWNAYHIISNRARSVCYATRQEHFKRQTEVAVNQLSQSTIEQLSAMRELAMSQQEIKDFTQASLENVQHQQEELSNRQEEIASKQDTVRSKISVNLEQLAKERTLINKGQTQLVNMTDSIKQQLEEASSLLSNQEKSRKQGQSEIIEDITRVRENIQQVWTRVDSSTSELLKVMAEISNQYQSTLGNLERINNSVSSMMSLVVTMDTAISTQLDWVVGQLGGAQNGLKTLSLLATHAVFLLLSTLIVLFVRAPGFARVSLLALVCGNAFMEAYYDTSLTFIALAAIEALIIACNWLFLWYKNGQQKYQQPLLVTSDDQPLPLAQPIDPLEPLVDDRWIRSSTPVYNELPIETLSHTPTKDTPFMDTPTKSSIPLKCTARTRAGSKCRLPATPGEMRCRKHL